MRVHLHRCISWCSIDRSPLTGGPGRLHALPPFWLWSLIAGRSQYVSAVRICARACMQCNSSFGFCKSRVWHGISTSAAYVTIEILPIRGGPNLGRKALFADLVRFGRHAVQVMDMLHDRQYVRVRVVYARSIAAMGGSMYTAHDAPCVAVDESSSTGAGSSLLGTVAARLHALSASSWSPPPLLGTVAARIIDRIPLPALLSPINLNRPSGMPAGRHMICMHALLEPGHGGRHELQQQNTLTTFFIYNRRELGRDMVNITRLL